MPIAKFSESNKWINECDDCFSKVFKDFLEETMMDFFIEHELDDHGFSVINEWTNIDWKNVQWIVGACEKHIDQFNKTNDMLELLKIGK